MIKNKALPSVAYGFKTCSQKYKTQPVDKFLNNHPDAIAAWKRGERVVDTLMTLQSFTSPMFGEVGQRMQNRVVVTM